MMLTCIDHFCTKTPGAVQEAMRMYPVAASGTARQTEQDMVMNGYIIPAGTVLVVPLYPLLNSPHVWDCPAEFRPVRLFR